MESTSPLEDVGLVTAPWTPEQVESLNGYQEAGYSHPFTCGNDHPGNDLLVATTDGWTCPSCDYTQAWAHGFMADFGWQLAIQQRERMLANIAAKREAGG